MSSPWKTLVFDCDGVLLDSNRIKTEAFYEVARQYGEQPAQALVGYHVQNGGISRYRKFEHLLSVILGLPASEQEVQQLSRRYGEIVFERLLSCPEASGLRELRQRTADIRWMIVSGGAETELRQVFAHRGLDQLFDAGIFGSPATKNEILSREMEAQRLVLPALFFGDSRYDHVAASEAGLDFVFVSRWSEFADWPAYCERHGIHIIEALDAGLAQGFDTLSHKVSRATFDGSTRIQRS